MIDSAPNRTDQPVFHARRADAPLWREARELYVIGLSPRAIADRLALGERNVRRRAAAEGWVRSAGVPLGRDARRRLAPESDPVLQALTAEHEQQVGELLAHPDAVGLRRFAFQRATDAAVAGSPVECTAWLRVIDALRRNGELVDADDRALEPRHMARAEYLYELVAADLEATRSEEDAEESEPSETSVRQASDAPDSLETKAWRPPLPTAIAPCYA